MRVQVCEQGFIEDQVAQKKAVLSGFALSPARVPQDNFDQTLDFRQTSGLFQALDGLFHIFLLCGG